MIVFQYRTPKRPDLRPGKVKRVIHDRQANP